MLQRIIPVTVKILSAIVLTSQLLACGGGGSGTEGGSVTPEAIISGSVGDGPIVGATLNIYDKDGDLVQTEMSNNSATYSARIKAPGKAYPLTIEVLNGTDLVTGRAPDFRLVSVVPHPSEKRVNINPYTTLIVETARSMSGGLNDQNIEEATTNIVNLLNFGLDPALVADPIRSEINNSNIANIVKSSEALGEMIRRAHDNLIITGTVNSADDIVSAIADDLSDGVLDGVGGSRASDRITAVATLVAAQVLVESLSNNLKVDGLRATDALDNSILSTQPGTPADALTDSVRVSQEMLEQARAAVAKARMLAPSIELTTISNVLSIIPAGSRASSIEPVLPGDTSEDLNSVISLANTSTDEQLAALNDATQPEPAADTDQTPEDGNSAPVISGSPASSIGVGSPYNFQPVASDADGDTLTFSIANRPAWASFNTVSGRLSGTPGDTNTGLFGNIVISVNDGSITRSLPAFSITVIGTQSTSNTAPAISGSPDSSVSEGVKYFFLPGASDPDGDNLAFTIKNRPSWANFNTATGRLVGTPTNTHVGTYSDITITVSDGSATASLGPFTIVVINVNDAPLISGTPALSVSEGNTYTFQPSASDADGDSLSFSIQNRPAWASFNSTNGRLSGTPAASDVGSYSNIVISVSDGSRTASLPAFGISVAGAAQTLGSAFLEWAAPAARSDGNSLDMGELAGYTLYYGATSGNYPNAIEINDPYTTSVTVSDLPTGTYYFVITARDTDGLESGYSNETTRLVQ